MKKQDKLHIIVPINMDLDWPEKEDVVEEILERYNNYGIKSFCLTAPCGGWRSVGYPSKERYKQFAELFKSVKEELKCYDIELAWWITLTVKNGGDFTPIVRDDGSEHPFSRCPFDPDFIKRFSDDVAMFAAIAKPSFIITEDDYSVRAAAGCYCKYHLEEFARRIGKYYTREEILEKCNAKTTEAIEFTKKWRKVSCDALVGLATAVRTALDLESPEIPMGYMQAGTASVDGDCTEAIARAFAGKNHTPFVRFHGCGYGIFDQRNIPQIVYSPLFEKQRIKGDMLFYHESDTFPHERFFRSGRQMGALMASVYSFGYDGSTFQANQLLDDGGEEHAYAKMLKRERARFNTAARISKKCEVRGVEISFDPFYNSYHSLNNIIYPYWSRCIGRFGIPYSTKDEPVAFWDVVNARFSDDKTVMKYLSKTLFLDARAAMMLCERGYGEYLGVSLGQPVTELHERLEYDLGAREVICEPYSRISKGKHMPSTHMFAPDGKGIEYEITVTNEKCEVISNLYSYDKKLISPAMTRFENSLGGKIIVFSMTIDAKNKSQSLYNYRRQRLIQQLICMGSDEYVISRNEPDIFVIQNEAKNEAEAGFKAMLTLTNLCDDEVEKLHLRLPEKYKGKTYMKMNMNGEWDALDCEVNEDGITLNDEFSGLETVYILIK